MGGTACTVIRIVCIASFSIMVVQDPQGKLLAGALLVKTFEVLVHCVELSLDMVMVDKSDTI